MFSVNFVLFNVHSTVQSVKCSLKSVATSHLTVLVGLYLLLPLSGLVRLVQRLITTCNRQGGRVSPDVLLTNPLICGVCVNAVCPKGTLQQLRRKRGKL